MEEQSRYYDKLSKLSSSDLLTILHDCVDILAPVSPSEMALHDCRSKKQILNRMEQGKYLIFNFDGRKYPVLNGLLKSQK